MTESPSCNPWNATTKKVVHPCDDAPCGCTTCEIPDSCDHAIDLVRRGYDLSKLYDDNEMMEDDFGHGRITDC
jgi:hypothetical protein